MIFIGILITSAILISSCAGYFSIYGLATIFASTFWPVVVMGGVLECGKLVAASYVYRYWDSTQIILKSYLIATIMILMFITSTGIFGFLSAAYQEESLTLKEIDQSITLLKSEKEEILFRKRQIDNDIASLPSNYVRGRQKLMKSYGPELSKINSRLDDITLNTSELLKSKLTTESHTGPIIYIANVFDKSVDDAIKYMILLIIFVFDPLAVILVICTNIAIKDHHTKNNKPALLDNTELTKDSKSAVTQVLAKKKITESIRSSK